MPIISEVVCDTCRRRNAASVAEVPPAWVQVEVGGEVADLTFCSRTCLTTFANRQAAAA